MYLQAYMYEHISAAVHANFSPSADLTCRSTLASLPCSTEENQKQKKPPSAPTMGLPDKHHAAEEPPWLRVGPPAGWS